MPRAQQQGMAMQARAAWGAAKAVPTTTASGRRTDPAPPAFPVLHPILTSCTFNRSISTSPSSSSALLAARNKQVWATSARRGGGCRANSRAHAHANTPYVRGAMGALRQTPFQPSPRNPNRSSRPPECIVVQHLHPQPLARGYSEEVQGCAHPARVEVGVDDWRLACLLIGGGGGGG